MRAGRLGNWAGQANASPLAAVTERLELVGVPGVCLVESPGPSSPLELVLPGK